MYLPKPIYDMKPVVILVGAAYIAAQADPILNLSGVCLGFAGLMIIRARGYI